MSTLFMLDTYQYARRQTGRFAPRRRHSTATEGAPLSFFAGSCAMDAMWTSPFVLFSPLYETNRFTAVVQLNECQLCATKVISGKHSCIL